MFESNRGLKAGLLPCSDLEQVAEVRVLGAIGVVELKKPVNMKEITQQFVDAGVWIRPFGKLVYLMPSYIMDDADIQTLCSAIEEIVRNQPQ